MSHPSHSYTLQISDRGLLSLPQEVGSELNFHPGDRLILTLEVDRSLRLVPLQADIIACLEFVADRDRRLVASVSAA